MKILIFGLGNFGHPLAINLTETGNEVIGIDLKMDKVERLRDKIAHVVCMDSTNELAFQALPIKETDLAIVAIGENEGAAIITTAILKKLNVSNIISRSLSPIHDTVLQAMGVDQIIHPEQEAADRLTRKINFRNVIDNFKIDDSYSVSEVKVLPAFVDKQLSEVQFRSVYNLNIVTIIRNTERTGLLGRKIHVRESLGVPRPETRLQPGDILVVFGQDRHIRHYCEQE
jgi:trk system potassium uptake protein TrkA